MIRITSHLFVAASLSAGILAGCATASKIPTDLEAEFARSADTSALIDSWRSAEPAITYVNDNGSFIISEPLRIPAEIAQKRLKTSLATTGILSDLGPLLANLGLYVSIPDPAVAKKPMVVFEFEGRLGDFLNALGAAYQVSFNWNPGNILTVEKDSVYMVKIPQDESVAKSVSANLSALGASDIDTSMEAGTVSYKADYRTHQRVINFLDTVSKNSALVSMQVAVINVALDKNKKSGIDWSKLNMHLGEAQVYANAQRLASKSSSAISGITGDAPIVDPAGGETAGSGGSSQAKSIADMLLTGGKVASMSALGGQGADIVLSAGDFAIDAVLNYLSTYGKTETSQSLLMKTLSGKKVTMKSASEVAYVDSIGVSNIGSSSSNNTDNNRTNNGSSNDGYSNNHSTSGLGLGSAQIETVDIGLELNLAPYYQAHSELITIDVDMKLSSLIAFVDLNVGNQIGTISRPSIQEQEFTDLIKIKAGETVVIGGITYDQKSDNRNAIGFLEKLGGAHKDAKFNRNSMIIMIRPTVTVFTKLDGDKRAVYK